VNKKKEGNRFEMVICEARMAKRTANSKLQDVAHEIYFCQKIFYRDTTATA
jgi:hypothetical protein